MQQARSATRLDGDPISPLPFARLRGPELRPRAKKALLFVLLLPGMLWLGYVVVVNIMLSTGLVARLVSYNPDDVTMHYESAWSVWPGVTHVKGFRVGGSDSVLQWVVEVDEASVDIQLTELLRKKFHAKKVRAQGWVLRVRLLVDPTSERDLETANIKGLPPIPGFTNPPLKLELPPEKDLEHSDEGYNLWTAHLEDIDTTVKEIWIQEVRYVGEGRVRGGFFFKPIRAVQVGPVVVELRSGELQLADHVIARLDVDVDATMETFDPRNIDGLDVFESTSARVRLDAQLPGLGFVNLYTGPGAGAWLEDGSGALRADLRLNKGLVEPGSSLSYGTSRLDVATPELRASAGGDVDVWVGDDGGAHAVVNVPRATLERPGKGLPPVVMEWVKAAVDAPELHLMRLPPNVAPKLSVGAAAIPDLRWLNSDDAAPGAPRFSGGALFLSARLDMGPAGRGKGVLNALMKHGAMGWKGMKAKADAEARIEIEGADVFAGTATLRKSRVEIKDLAIEREGEAWPSWWARIDIDKGMLGKGLMEASVRIECKDAQPAVELLDAEDVIPGWAAGLLTMEGLKASATVKKKGDDVDFKLLRAEGGSLAIRGRLRKSGAEEPTGAFLVRSGVLSVGIGIEADGAGVKLLAGESWVDEKMAALDR